MSMDERLQRHLAAARRGDGAARLSAMLAETRALLNALHADQERIDREIAALRAAESEQPRDAVSDLLRRMTLRDEEKAKG